MILLFSFSIALGIALIVFGVIIDRQATRIHKLIRQVVDLQENLTYAYSGDSEKALTDDVSGVTLYPAVIKDGIIELPFKDE